MSKLEAVRRQVQKEKSKHNKKMNYSIEHFQPYTEAYENGWINALKYVEDLLKIAIKDGEGR